MSDGSQRTRLTITRLSICCDQPSAPLGLNSSSAVLASASRSAISHCMPSGSDSLMPSWSISSTPRLSSFATPVDASFVMSPSFLVCDLCKCTVDLLREHPQKAAVARHHDHFTLFHQCYSDLVCERARYR